MKSWASENPWRQIGQSQSLIAKLADAIEEPAE